MHVLQINNEISNNLDNSEMVPYEVQKKQNIKERKEKWKELSAQKTDSDNLKVS